MAPKADTNKQAYKKSVVIVPSKSAPVENQSFDDVEATEIAAEISVPTEGGWGWVVVLASFLCCFILDGIFFTFGSIYQDMAADIQTDPTLVALINSAAVSVYLMSGPIASALVNRFGFRAVTMSGSVILSISYLCAYFATSYLALIMFYGLMSGFGGCLVLVPSIIVVGFYFERLRAIALAIASVGSSVGIMVMFMLNSYLIKIAGWRILTLMHSALFGLIFFFAMAFRPLLSVNITTTTTGTQDPTRTVTYLPSLVQTQTVLSKAKGEGPTSTAAERLFGAVSNVNFPTAASVVQEGVNTPSQAGSSAGAVSKLTLKARNPTGSVSRKQLSQVKSMVSRANLQDKINVEIAMKKEKHTKKLSFWARLCTCEWEQHVTQSRPMYRDDAFYNGKLENLPVYQKSVMVTDPDQRTGLEYQLAVSRAVTVAELEENKGVCTTATKRILATMLDPQLLKSCSFLLICCSAVLFYVGLLTPYVYLADRNKSEGIPEVHCNLFVSVIGLCNAIGKLLAGVVAYKFDPLMLYLGSSLIGGFGAIAFNFSSAIYSQYVCCVVFGVFVAGTTSVRSIVLVQCYGLEKLTNATGMLLMSQGFGSIMSTPLSGVLKGLFGYAVSFYVAGGVMILSGVVLMPVKKLVNKEKAYLEESKNVTTKESAKPRTNKPV